LNYKPANDEYKAAWAASNAAPGASGSSAGAGRPKSVKDMDPRGLLGLPAAWPTASASSAATAVARWHAASHAPRADSAAECGAARCLEAAAADDCNEVAAPHVLKLCV